ncbi:hypothetical protein [Cuniculiplasma divulgatum]|jgi:DNA replication initiation complex subunit (GINS family)|uniref:DNA replication initiation complex subunit, GINS15 family n=1 Tax=Cuniculiplasma divulgatum TaxID=1673428 RepID=A0A1N5SLI6_9ARCH|nr:hypothetical protein [Cuniculiplasma divulgatum]MCI2412979.1 hypothetical protein [Cuniculiplasma sp.]MCL4319726.1 hypothetical protein [Candidatus Thermoplasmatota archaeon]OWP54972.1 MAG: hypothetical protein B2I18_07185 [Cuniculiplasma sp. C_DKE]MCL6015108.1 hypothetical protein [Candidatus Thermoplasmatota archaeon]SIM36918.1 DNA replication initiation complex subunit, GINS15 family [Cuniculiplasma divulgatum]
MGLSIVEIERITKEIREYYRIESSSQSIQRIKPSFYTEVREALTTLNEMAAKSVSESRIENYRKIMDKKEKLENNLRNFLLKRYEKLLRDSLFDISSKTYEPLAPEEKTFIMENHNKMMAYLERIIKPEEEPGKEEENEESISTPETGDGERKIENGQKIRTEAEKMSTVSVTADFLPVATSVGDFYLHKGDIVFLPDTVTEILVSRKYARKILLEDIIKN